MLFYRSPHKTAPTWMKSPVQRDYKGFYVYCDSNAMSWPAPDANWDKCEDTEMDQDISYVLIGAFNPQLRETYDSLVKHIKTPCGSSVPVYPAMDRTGKAWTVPMIINENGATLALTWSTENGAVVRNATDQQRLILTTCESMRDSLTSDGDMTAIPMDILGKAAGLIMSYAYHVNENEFLLFGLLDDFLVPRILWAACGMGTPEHPSEYAK